MTSFFNNFVIVALYFVSSSIETTASMDGLSESDKESSTGTAIGLIIRNKNIFATPYIGRSEGDSEFGMQFGILLPQ